MRHAASFAVALLVAVFAGTSSGATPDPYKEAVASATRAADDGQHLAAAELFGRALELAANDNDRLACRLAMADERIAANSHDAVMSEIENLLQPYREGKPRDDVWSATMQELARFSPRPRALELQLEVAAHWASQPSGPLADEQFARATALLADTLNLRRADAGSLTFTAALELIRGAARNVASHTARAQIAYAYATTLQQYSETLKTDPATVARAFDDAVTEAKGTPTEANAITDRAFWWLRSAPFAWEQWSATQVYEPNGPRDQTASRFRWLTDRLREAYVAAKNGHLDGAAQNLQAQADELATPFVRIEIDAAVIPGVQVPFALDARHTERVDFTLHAVDAATLAALLARKSDQPPPPLPTAIAQWSVATGVSGGLGRIRTQQHVPGKLSAGFYVLVVNPADQPKTTPSFHWFAVTRLQAVAWVFADRTLEVWAYDQFTGAPPNGITAVAQLSGKLHAFGGTREGHAKTVLPTAHESYAPVNVLGEADGQPFVITGLWTDATPLDDPVWAIHVSTDRPLYQPGETVHWKLVTRRESSAGATAPVGEPIEASIKINDTVLGPQHVTLNRFGTASGEFRLPVDTPSSSAIFEIAHPRNQEPFSRDIETFAVSRFRPPEAQLTITPSAADSLVRARHEGGLALTAKASYYSGDPVSAGQVRLTGVFWNKSRLLDEDSPAEHPGAALRFNVVTTLDRNGTAAIELPIPRALAADAFVALEASLDGSGIRARTKFEADLPASGYIAQLATTEQATASQIDSKRSPDLYSPSVPRVYAPPGKSVSLQLLTQDGTRAPISARGYVTTTRLTWDEIWRTPDQKLVTGEALREARAQWGWPAGGPKKKGWESIRAEYRRDGVDSADVVTDASGRATFATPVLDPGYYQVRYFGDRVPNDGNPLAEIEIIVADEKTRWLGMHVASAFLLPCETPLTPGSPLRYLFVSPQPSRRVAVAFSTATRSESQIVALTGDTALIEFPWRADLLQGGRIGAILLSDGIPDINETQMAIADASISTADQRINLTVEPDGQPRRPGDKAAIALHTRDARGNPVPAEVSLTVADAAVVNLVEENHSSIEEDMIGFRRSTALRGGRSAAVSAPAPSEVEDGANDGRMHDNRIAVDTFTVFGAAQSVSLAAAADPRSEPRVRTNFSYTAYWAPDILTDARGEARVDFQYPDSLTEWSLRAEAVGLDNRFGSSAVSVRTSLPLQSRLRIPRALVAGDRATLIGAVVNTTPSAVPITAELTLPQQPVLAQAGQTRQQAIAAAAQEAQFFWPVQARAAGSVAVHLAASSGKESDAMELPLPVHEDGFMERGGWVRRSAGQPLTAELLLPSPLDANRTHVELQLSAGTLPNVVAALPYLIDYPYGCVEQTTSRFVPAAVAAKILRTLGFSAAEVDQALTKHDDLLAPPLRTSAGLPRLDDVIAQSLSRLAAAQNRDGAFPWLGGGAPDAFMTAYVLRALNLAASAGVAVPKQLHAGVAHAALAFLDSAEPRLLATRSWLLASVIEFAGPRDREAQETIAAAYGRIFERRLELSDAGLALLAQSAIALHRKDDVTILRQNLEKRVHRGRSTEFGETAQWGLTRDYFDAGEGAVESTALCVQALVRIDPRDSLAAAAANWLLMNRQSNAWHNTRETALAALALLEYADARGETAPAGAVTIAVNGHPLYSGDFNQRSLLAPTRLVVENQLLRPGKNEITFHATPGASAYLVAVQSSWAPAQAIAEHGSFITIQRQYARIADRISAAGTPIAISTPIDETGAWLNRGDRLECKLTVTAQHDVDYVLIESPKPGGAEPVNPLSGWDVVMRPADSSKPDTPAPSGRIEHGIFREEYDDRSALFLPHLPAGRWEIVYTMNATFTGNFRILPVQASPMYLPFVTANSRAGRMAIEDK